MTADELNKARRLAAQWTERWDAIGQDIFQHGTLLGTMRSVQLAELVAAIHNTFLPATNNLLMALRRLADKVEMEKHDVEYGTGSGRGREGGDGGRAVAGSGAGAGGE